jgi:Amt family ammonium transporter
MFDRLPGSAKRAAAALLPALLLASPVLAADAAPVPDKGDTAWMMVSTLLVLLMILPGLQLFYGGLTRTKNMLSTMTQIGAATCLAMLMWVVFG